MSDQPEIWVCATCRTGAVSIDIEDEHGQMRRHGWLHSRRGEEDHPVVPVRARDLPGAEIRTVCDIDGTPAPDWVWYTTGSDMVTLMPTGSAVTFADRDNAWMVCAGCLPLVRADDAVGLLRRRLANPVPGTEGRRLTTTERAWILDRITGFLLTRLPEPEPRLF